MIELLASGTSENESRTGTGQTDDSVLADNVMRFLMPKRSLCQRVLSHPSYRRSVHCGETSKNNLYWKTVCGCLYHFFQ